MRVFYINADSGIDPEGSKGASVHLRSIAAALARSGHEVTGFSRRLAEKTRTISGVPWHRFKTTEELAAHGRRTSFPQVVLERYSLSADLGLSFAREHDVPFVLEVNAPLVLEARIHRPKQLQPDSEAMERRLFREADWLICVSNTPNL